jgi:hypothetical protein
MLLGVQIKMTELETHHRKSLTDAGIGAVYHDQGLSDAGTQGETLKKFLISGGGDEMKYQGGSLMLHGYSRNAVTLLARALHLHGCGVRMVSLSKLVTLRRRNNEAWEDIVDCRALFIIPAQTNRDNPLSPWQADETEDFLLTRAQGQKSVVMCFDDALPEKPWWSDDFLKSLAKYATVMNAGDKK